MNAINTTSQTSSHARPIIINVDDLGLSTAVNEAVIHLAELGRISASSYMVGGTITDSDINQLKKLKVDVGLHLDLTGMFHSALRGSLKSILIASYLHRLNPMQVTDIIKQQLDAFEDCFGHAPIFIDGHQHIHQFPVIRHCLIKELIARYGNDILQGSLSARVTTPLVNDLKSWIIYTLGGHAWQHLCQTQQIATNHKFGGVYGFDVNTEQLAALWQQWFKHAPLNADNTPTLIMCHPAIPDNYWQDEIKTAREQEYHWLISAEFEDLLLKYDIKLVRWSKCT